MILKMFNALYNLNGLNKKLFFIINNFTNQQGAPKILKFISKFFALKVVTVYFIIIAIILLLYLKKNTKHFWKIYYYFSRMGIIYVFISFVYTALKFVINMPRPFCSLPPENFKSIYNDFSDVRCLSSFPSAHTAFAIFVLYTIWPFINYTQKIIFLLIICLVGLSRISLAMHYPSDVLYSIPLVFLCIVVGNNIYKLFKNNLIKMIGNFILSYLNK